jgi:multisubunit Na+/H+ antiporter MnhB subunit
MILAARFLLLLSGVGAFALAYLALSAPDLGKIAVLVVYVLGVVLPIAYLYLRNGHGAEQEGSGS